MEEDNRLIEERREKLKALRAAGSAYPNHSGRRDLASQLNASHGEKTKEALEKTAVAASIAGRMMLKRPMGKVTFATLQDGSGRIQIYVSNDLTGEKRSEEHTSELQSLAYLVCRLLLEKKKKTKNSY